MNQVELLIWARHAIEALQPSANPDAALAAGYELLGQGMPNDRGDVLAVRIARLLAAADDSRRLRVLNTLLGYEHLQSRGSSQAPQRRRSTGNDDAGAQRHAQYVAEHEDPEALRLAQYVMDHAAEAWPMFGEMFPPFVINQRSAVGWFDPDLIVRERENGRRIRLRDGTHPDDTPEGVIKVVDIGKLPVTARGIIDVHVDTPVVFDIVTGYEPWRLWDICLAFANQYERLGNDPRSFLGSIGGLPDDFWIEELYYFPEERLISL